MTDIEAVARAICTACDERPDVLGDARGNEKRWQDYVPVATAAIKAMAGDDVLIKLARIEGYEDVHPELISEEAILWPYFEILWPTEWPTEEYK